MKRSIEVYLGIIRVSLLSLGIPILQSGCGGSTESISKPNVISGTEAKARLFSGVVYLNNGCTAAKIGARTFLTAAHCVVNRSSNVIRSDYLPGSSLRVSDSPRLDTTATWTNLTIEKTIAHPTYRVADARCGTSCNALGQNSFDVALVRVTADSSSLPIMA